ncbi:cupin domain-containing protein [Deltaproteobacteria bacterium OttesenSCG-928-M10]|nr:cupin domain-containing protein [Deltaproteobacteria bacterium OttesenSCG-928-M10]
MSDIDQKQLEGMIRKVLTEILTEKGGSGEMVRQVDKSGVMSVKTSTVKTEKFPFDIGPANGKVFLKDMVSLEESPRLGFGVMEMDRTSFKWTLNYDEVDYIIDGTLEIVIDGRKVTAGPGDTLFIPAKSTIEFSSPGFSRFLYVVYPANWSEQ